MRLARGQRRWVDATGYALLITGGLWLMFHYFMDIEGEFGPAPHPLQSWWRNLHGAAAMVALIVAGSLLPVHVRRGWHQRVNLTWGVILSVALLALTVTGYALYYLASEQLRPLISVLHWVLGLVLPLLVVMHIRSGRSARRTAPDARTPDARTSGS